MVGKRFESSAFTGEGARSYGGRWNSKGVAVVYTASSVSLAMLEMLVRVHSPEALEQSFSVTEARFKPELCEFVKRPQLPAGWRNEPLPLKCQEIGDAWIHSMRSAVLAVPSVISPSEWNYLLNVAHPHFPKILIGRPKPLTFDSRLFRRL